MAYLGEIYHARLTVEDRDQRPGVGIHDQHDAVGVAALPLVLAA